MIDQPTPSRRAGLRDEIATAISEATGDRWPAQAFLTEADAVLAVLYREWPWLRAEAEDAEPAPAGLREQTAAATLDRVRNIPRLPHSSQQTGNLGRAYTRGWESVISALDAALDQTEEQPKRPA